jgi:1-deoxy-D-xylulose-5-phosphate reductoisomerase
MQYLTILGSTGSIGVSTLDVVERNPERFAVVALTARSRIDVLFEQCCKFRPRYAVVIEAQDAERLQQQLRAAGSETQVLCGTAALETVAALPEVSSVLPIYCFPVWNHGQNNSNVGLILPL